MYIVISSLTAHMRKAVGMSSLVILQWQRYS